MIHVWDANPEMPARQEPGPGDESGRGLMIIDAVSTRWGACQAHNGKIVWAQIGQAADARARRGSSTPLR